MSDSLPFWETLVGSLVASGILSSLVSGFMSSRSERKKQDKQLRLERLEKSMTLLRKNYDEVFQHGVYYLETHDKATGFQPSVNPLDLHVAILMCAPRLDAVVKEYIGASTKIVNFAKMQPNSARSQEWLDGEIGSAINLLKQSHDATLTTVLSVCHEILGIKATKKKD
jgi:hypothetical protein